MKTFKCVVENDSNIITGEGGVEMIMLVRKKKEFFTDFIAREATAKKLRVILNGSFIDLTFGSKVAVLTSGGALSADESTPIGQVIQEGKLLAGTSSTGKFNFAQETCGVEGFSARVGNPSTSACSAIGGIAPIIIGGMPYGAHNAYRAGVPAGAPLSGDVAEKFTPYLVQKSNAMFLSLLSRGRVVGKSAIGYSSVHKKLTIVVQQDGRTGLDADGVRRIFVNNAVNNAVFVDCSDSATLFYDGKFLVRPGSNKNEFLTVAVGFR